MTMKMEGIEGKNEHHQEQVDQQQSGHDFSVHELSPLGAQSRVYQAIYENRGKSPRRASEDGSDECPQRDGGVQQCWHGPPNPKAGRGVTALSGYLRQR